MDVERNLAAGVKDGVVAEDTADVVVVECFYRSGRSSEFTNYLSDRRNTCTREGPIEQNILMRKNYMGEINGALAALR